ncbi:replication-relaxation family protein [Streptomyces mirabilis]|uniref:replication-relaxation family protein n=1 Tax=Streptomyces mirabilis TaxID=68239 RepID=UPI0036C4B46F
MPNAPSSTGSGAPGSYSRASDSSLTALAASLASTGTRSLPRQIRGSAPVCRTRTGAGKPRPSPRHLCYFAPFSRPEGQGGRVSRSGQAGRPPAVVRAHLAFAEDARRLGHEHGPKNWTPEVSHSIGEGERVVADAVMYYTVAGSEHRRKLRAFVEVDRTTMSSERLAVKLIEYARLFQYEAQPIGRRRQAAAGPAWLRWYPVFPRVLFVLTGASRSRLENRMSDLQAMVAQHPLVAALAREVRLGTAVLEDIEQHGPAQAVWIPLAGGKPRPWTDL